MFRKPGLYIGIVLLYVSLSSCAIDSVTGKKSYNFFKISDDIGFGSQVMKQQLSALKKSKKTYDSPRNKKQLILIETIMKRIAAVSHYPDFPYEAHLAELPIVNAWCAPGGKIMVYEGLWGAKGLVKKSSSAELAAVIAHEISHATARHVTESLSRNMTVLFLGQMATSIISTASKAGSNLFGRMFMQGVEVFMPSYSRKNELEADRVGLIYMAKAGYDPGAAVRLWDRAAQLRGDKTSIYASHPSSGDRAKALKKLLPEAMELYEASKRAR